MRSVLFALLFSLPMVSVAEQRMLQHSPLEASFIRDNLCSNESVQARLIANYNSVPQFIAAHGALKKVADLHTTDVSIVNETLSCEGKFTFADGRVAETEYGFQFDFRTP